MTIEDLICYGKKYLHTNEVYMLLSNLLNYDNLELLNYLDEKVEDTKVIKFKKMIEKVINKEPIQYVLGNVNFFGYTFTVDKNVLIPRFETEELVSYTIDYINKFFNENVIPHIENHEMDFFKDYKSVLQEFVQTDKKSLEYKIINESGPAHNKQFTAEVLIGDIVYGVGTAHSKKGAEQEAAKNALKKAQKG